MSNNLDVQIVLDRSGSMHSAWSDTVGGLNQYVTTLAEQKDVESRITVLVFDSESIDTIRSGVAAATFTKVDVDEVLPRGGTPLFDAVGRGIHDMRHRLPRHRKALVVLTDGYENASREHTARSIRTLIKTCQRDDWLVTYLGADHDAWGQASGMGFAAAHVGQYSKGREKAVFRSMSSNVRSYAASGAPEQASFTDEQRLAMSDDGDE